MQYAGICAGAANPSGYLDPFTATCRSRSLGGDEPSSKAIVPGNSVYDRMIYIKEEPSGNAHV
jgi:hypothetical protein